MRACLWLFAFLLLPLPALAQTVCPAPAALRFEVTGEVRRSEVGFTEGLEFHDGVIYESTGDVFGTTRINRIDPQSGKVEAVLDRGHAYFGEGLTFFGGRLYQMTWKEHQVFVFDAAGRQIQVLKNPREGWGLTHDAGRLIASDGSSRLFFLRPSDFATLGSVTVREGRRTVSDINELEYVNGSVYANVFTSWRLLRIAPMTGCVTGVADLRSLRARMRPQDRDYIDAESNFVPNGIAHDPATGLFTLTGKYWPMLYTGRLMDAAKTP